MAKGTGGSKELQTENVKVKTRSSTAVFYNDVVFKEMDPEEFVSFKNKVVIKKMDVRKYEQELKKELSNWIVVGQRQKVTIVRGVHF